jgi:hypothetical protein
MAPTLRFKPGTGPFVAITFIFFVLTLGIHFHLFSKNDTDNSKPNPPVTTEPPGIGLDLTGFYGYFLLSL